MLPDDVRVLQEGAEPGKIDLGRTIGEAEIQNLPLVSRNPYNFALVQPGVTGVARWRTVERGNIRVRMVGME